jgi:Xaa-Pro aminopeptidase
MYWLEKEMEKQNSQLTEISVAAELERLQSLDSAYESLSFDSISAVGPNAADIHYSPDPVANVTLKKNQMYMLDAGAQYW